LLEECRWVSLTGNGEIKTSSTLYVVFMWSPIPTRGSLHALKSPTFTFLTGWKKVNSPWGLKRDICKAVDVLKVGNESAFFLNVVGRAVEIASAEESSEGVLVGLIKEIGLFNLAWCVPVTSCFWSYRADSNFNDWFYNANAQRGSIQIKDNKYEGSSLRQSVYKEYESYIKASNYNLPPYSLRCMDIDTFLSISFSLIAAKKGLGCMEKDLEKALDFFGDDISGIAEDLVR